MMVYIVSLISYCLITEVLLRRTRDSYYLGFDSKSRRLTLLCRCDIV